jgi:hypothetical protein
MMIFSQEELYTKESVTKGWLSEVRVELRTALSPL